MAIHSSTLDLRIPRTEKPDGLYSPRSHRESDTTEAIQHIHTHDMLRLRNFLTHSGLQFLHFNLFMDVPCGLQDLSFLTRDRTCILGNESVES